MQRWPGFEVMSDPQRSTLPPSRPHMLMSLSHHTLIKFVTLCSNTSLAMRSLGAYSSGKHVSAPWALEDRNLFLPFILSIFKNLVLFKLFQQYISLTISWEFPKAVNETKKEVPLSVHIPNDHDSQDCSTLRPGGKNLVRISHVVAGATCHLFPTLQSKLVGSWIDSWIAVPWNGGQHCRQWHNPPCHNAGPCIWAIYETNAIIWDNQLDRLFSENYLLSRLSP